MPSLQVTEALDNEELPPARIPYNLLQQLCQAPAFIAALQLAIPYADGDTASGRKYNAVSDAQRSAPSGAIHWTARLSVPLAAADVQTAPDDGASSSIEPVLEGPTSVEPLHLSRFRFEVYRGWRRFVYARSISAGLLALL